MFIYFSRASFTPEGVAVALRKCRTIRKPKLYESYDRPRPQSYSTIYWTLEEKNHKENLSKKL